MTSPISFDICLKFILAFQFPLPFLSCICLHIDNGVTFIHNFPPDDGFDDVFHRDNAQEASVFVLHLCDVFFLLEDFYPHFADQSIFVISQNRATDVLQSLVELVFRQFFQYRLLQDKTGDEVRIFVIDRDS